MKRDCLLFFCEREAVFRIFRDAWKGQLLSREVVFRRGIGDPLLHSIPLSRWKSTRNEKKDQRSGMICLKLKPGNHRGFRRFQVRRYCKNLKIFMAGVFFAISGGELETAKVLHKTRIKDKLDAIWLSRAQNDLPSPSRNCRWGNYTVRACLHGGSVPGLTELPGEG